MKYKMLSAVIATALLSGCGSSSSDSSYSVKAYDPAVANMDVKYDCEDGSSGFAASTTDGDGIANITAFVPANAPDTCEFTLIGRSNSVDMSNGKDMSGVTYTIPKGMAVAGQLVTGSPFSSLLAAQLDGADYSEEAAIQLLTDLGLDSLLEGDVTIEDIMLDPESAAESLTDAEASKLLATSAVVSDTITANPDADADDLIAASEAIAAVVIAEYPDYPENEDGDDIYVDVKDASEAAVESSENDEDIVVDVDDIEEEEAVEVEEAPTGGTGGTGGNGSDDGTGA